MHTLEQGRGSTSLPAAGPFSLRDAVSNALSAGGFDQARWVAKRRLFSGRTKGGYTIGFRMKTDPVRPGVVLIDRTSDDMGYSPDEVENRAIWVGKYADALVAKGFAVDREQDDLVVRLVVRRGTASVR